jgi:hypothetical protein
MVGLHKSEMQEFSLQTLSGLDQARVHKPGCVAILCDTPCKKTKHDTVFGCLAASEINSSSHVHILQSMLSLPSLQADDLGGRPDGHHCRLQHARVINQSTNKQCHMSYYVFFAAGWRSGWKARPASLQVTTCTCHQSVNQ